MDAPYLYATSFLSHWWPLVSTGSLLGVEEFAERYWPWARVRLGRVPGPWRSRLKIAALMFAALWSGYLAWSDEYAALVAMRGQKDRLQGQLESMPATQQKTIDHLKSELEKTKREVSQLRAASQLPNHLYQDGRDVAIVANVSYDKVTNTLIFGLLTAQAPVDFRHEIQFQRARIFCEDKKPYGSAAMGAKLNLEYSQVTCHVLGPIEQPGN